MTRFLSTWARRYGRLRWIVRIGLVIGGWLFSRRRPGQGTNVVQGRNNLPR